MLFAIASLVLAAATTPPNAAVDPSGLVQQADLKLGSAVIDRQAQPLPEKIVAGQTVYAVTEISGPGGGFVEHVWTRDGKEVARHYLPVGPSKRWRTWSRHTVVAGQYRLQILAQNGTQLREATFEVIQAAED